MATYMGPSPIENYWKSQSATLRDIRDHLGYERYDAKQYKPLPDRHPLLHKATRPKPHSQPRRYSTTPPAKPPAAKPPAKRYSTPPVRTRRESPSLRGSKYDVVPPVETKRAFESPTYRKREEDDSWGEESETEEDDRYPGYQPYPYPMMMYPMPMMMAPPPMPSVRRSHGKRDKPKKKVHYRNTPVYLSSREHTKHEPRLSRHENTRESIPDEIQDTVQDRAQVEQTLHDTYWDSVRDRRHDPFDPRSNSVLGRYGADKVPALRRQPLPPSHPYYPASFYYCEDFLDEEVKRLVHEVVHDSTSHIADGYLLHKLEQRDPLEDFLTNILKDVIETESTAVVKEVVQEFVNDHLEKTAAYDEILDMTKEIMAEMGPEVVMESLFENMLEDIIDEELIEPEINQYSEDLAVGLLTHYSNKVRSRDVHEIKKNSGEKAMEMIFMDYLMAHIARSGQLWTEGEHANRLLDEIMLTISLGEFFGVHQKRRATVENKPVRRYYEKVVTDVTLDMLLEEVSKCLDEDMADLDEYEQGLENPDINYEMPKELKKFLSGK